MKRMYSRTKIAAAESAELWERWKRGEGLHAIGQALGRWHTSIFAHLRPSGGIKPPAQRAFGGGGRSLLLSALTYLTRQLDERFERG